MICLDSSVLIEYYRKQDKRRAWLFSLRKEQSLCVPAIVSYEVLRGATPATADFWEQLLAGFQIMDFDQAVARVAAAVYQDLRLRNQMIGAHDILIAATALRHSLPVATLNARDFTRIPALQVITPEEPS